MDQAIVYIVDDDHDVRKALARSLSQEGFSVESFANAEEFLEQDLHQGSCCLVLDVRMPGMNGLDLHQYLLEQGEQIPVIFITGHGDIPMSVRAIKGGAFEFLEKPYQVSDLLEKIRQAIEFGKSRLQESKVKADILSRYEKLTGREKEVLQLLIADTANASNKSIARKLNISHRTVDDHRAKIMQKMEASSLVDLVEMTKICGVYIPIR